MAHGTTYRKVDFIWGEPQRRLAVPDRLTFRPVETSDDSDRFIRTVQAVLTGSLDLGDQHAVATQGGAHAARSYVEPDPLFVYERSWWHLAYDATGNLVGFTQPVTYRGSERDGLMEATIHYIGVVPEQRGNGYIDDLLRHTTRTLQDIGVWRIFTDTGVLNLPMQRAFERAGYQRGEEHERSLTLLRH